VKNAGHSVLQPGYQQSLRLECECSFTAVREAAQLIRHWLASHGLSETDLGAWELALVEAGNNAVEHVLPERQSLPLVLEVAFAEKFVEARVTDHTAGFEFPDNVDLPDFDSEGGRGVFLIKSLTDHAVYLRSAGENQLILRKNRSQAAKVHLPDVAQLQRQLAESEAAVSEMSEELSSSYESLVAMFRYSAEMGNSGNLHEFAGRLLADVLQLTESDAAVLRLFENGRLKTFLIFPGDQPETFPSVEGLAPSQSLELEAVKMREDVWFDGRHPLSVNDPLRAVAGGRIGLVHVFGSGDQPLGTIAVIRTRNDQPMRSAQVNILHTLVDFLAIQIVNSRLQDERTQSRVTRRELEIAANIQRSLLPVSIPKLLPFAVAASCTNAREVGGDFYDVLRVGDSGLLIVIADVMGKGVPAALFAAVLRSAVRSIPGLFSEPAALLSAVNRALCDDLSRVDMFATAKVIYLDVHRHCIVSASAGHCPLLLWQPDRPAAEVADNAGLPLGIDLEMDYQQTVLPFPPGAVALLFTDGLSELRNNADRMFGIEGLQGLLPGLSPAKVPAETVSAKLLQELDNYRAGAALSDDQTFVILRHEL
jgi:serine phosphatase RsbU (regulator of sigma subunit)/anti-sigma regulatory factor (Ser/Thr protein kinase)